MAYELVLKSNQILFEKKAFFTARRVLNQLQRYCYYFTMNFLTAFVPLPDNSIRYIPVCACN